jgi:hypothetical protein
LFLIKFYSNELFEEVVFAGVSVNRWHYVDANVFNLSFVQLLFSSMNYVDIVQHPRLFFFFRSVSLSVYIYSFFPTFVHQFSSIFFIIPTIVEYIFLLCRPLFQCCYNIIIIFDPL